MLMMVRVCTPGVVMSTRNTLMPLCFGASKSVRAASQHQSEMCAPLVHVFCPFST